ncbi:MAG: hypothetical protein CH104c_0351 [Candidatus Woesebacteria bacterium]|nr:MAG: hypothetical protein CH104c_0351 [Candidatus Woesebacteria bacterium]
MGFTHSSKMLSLIRYEFKEIFAFVFTPFVFCLCTYCSLAKHWA